MTDSTNTLEKSLSETDLDLIEQASTSITPPNFVTARLKRKRGDDFSTDLSAFKDDLMKSMAALFSNQETKIGNICSTLKDIQHSNYNIESNIAFLTDQNRELKENIEQLKTQRREDREYITLLENKIEDMQMSNRKTNFEMKNVPRKDRETKEDLIEMVLCLSKSVGTDLIKTDIKDVYRIRGKKEGNPNNPIIVETNSTIVRTTLLKLCKNFNVTHKDKLCAKHLGLRKSEDTPIFISENLTSRGSRLHFIARDLVKTKKFKYCWTAYGKVYVRKDDNSPVITIKSESQCHQLMNTI